jgi:hypothetical protein
MFRVKKPLQEGPTNMTTRNRLAIDRNDMVFTDCT